jgi:thymidylate synthase (FAD)
MYNRIALESVDIYKELMKNGVAPEQARSVLPQGTYTEWWWTGSLSAYARVFKQRIDAHAQWEIQQYADAIGKILKPLFPHSWAVLTTK